MERRALVVLVGITADKSKRASVLEYFSQTDEYDVYVPKLPQRLGVNYCAQWLKRYLSRTVVPQRYHRVDYIHYISGGLIFRHAIQTPLAIDTGRLVFIRGPIQEMVPAALVSKYGKFLTLFLLGKMVLDLSTADLSRPPLPQAFEERGLIIETGVSALAGSLGLSSETVPPEAFRPEQLLPGATDWRRVPESHDDVYSSPSVLSLALEFLRYGRFPESV